MSSSKQGVYENSFNLGMLPSALLTLSSLFLKWTVLSMKMNVSIISIRVVTYKNRKLNGKQSYDKTE